MSVALYSIDKGYLSPKQIKENIFYSNIFWFIVNTANLITVSIVAASCKGNKCDTSFFGYLGSNFEMQEVDIVQKEIGIWGLSELNAYTFMTVIAGVLCLKDAPDRTRTHSDTP